MYALQAKTLRELYLDLKTEWEKHTQYLNGTPPSLLELNSL